MMQRTILITGATSGIGRACAFQFAALGNRLILTGRRKEVLLRLAAELRELYKTAILPLVFDISKLTEVEKHLGNLPEEWEQVDVLVNNAGLALGMDPIHEGNPDDWEKMIDTNIRGVLYVTRMITPGMVKRSSGHIINIGSIAGKEAYPRGNVYSATKFAVDGLSKACRIDLLPYGIRVSQVCPGAVETEFSIVRYKGDKARASEVYKGFAPLTPEDVAGAVTWIAGLPAHVNVNDLVLMPTAQASPAYFHKDIR